MKIILCLLLGSVSANDGRSGMNPLIKKLFLTQPYYNPRVRPVQKAEDKTAVGIFVALTHIEAVDEKQQKVKLHGVIATYWIDSRLRWDQKEYNTSTMLMPSVPFPVWKPDVAILNSHSPFVGIWRDYVSVLLHFDGQVIISADFTATVGCSFSFIHYPNDRHRCQLIFGSLMYNASQLKFVPRLVWAGRGDIGLSGSRERNKKHAAGWEILNGTIQRKPAFASNEALVKLGITKPGPDSETQIPLFVVEVEFVRHKPYFYLVEVIPMAAVAGMTLISFWIDAPVLTLAILLTCILAQGIFSWDIVAELPPSTDGLPRIVIAYAFNLIMSSVAFILHLILERFKEQGPLMDILPALVSSWVRKADQSVLVRGSDLRPYTRPRSSAQFVHFPPVDQSEMTKANTVVTVMKRLLFWAFLIAYAIFIVVIAV